MFFSLFVQAALIDRSKGKAGGSGGDDGDGDDNDDGDQEGSGAAYTLTQGTLEKHLRLDSAAASAVMLLPDPSNPHQYGSLYNVLNRCAPIRRASGRTWLIAHTTDTYVGQEPTNMVDRPWLYAAIRTHVGQEPTNMVDSPHF